MIAKVLVEVPMISSDGLFYYNISDKIKDKIKIGIRVKVPLKTREVEGFIMSIEDNDRVDFSLKDIEELIDEDVILNDELLNLGYYMQKHTLSNLINCFQTMLPKALKAKNNVLINKKYIKYIELVDDENIINEFLETTRSLKSKEVIKRLKKDIKVLKKEFDNSIISSLEKKKIVKIVEEETYRLISDDLEYENKILNDDQKNAVNQVILNESNTYLLHGITGSGKTLCYMEIIDRVIKEGKQAIMLVPEISLTPQITKVFQSRFKSVAILHSSLSDGERYDEYRKIQNNEASVVIGTRSAIFAPLTNIGVIIIDEEHETTYKQDNNPRYHTHDIAKERSLYHNCPLVLGSATPLIESYARASKGNYKLLTLENRAGNSSMPNVEIVDMRNNYGKILSDIAINKINDVLSKQEQAIILINKRGYANFVSCPKCGFTHTCPNCDISLTYHKSSNMMRCHYCNHAEYKQKNCKSCNQELKDIGYGSEQVQEYINDLFKDVRTTRMDVDTTRVKNGHKKIINSFNNYEYDILIGTQMIAKGLDFDRVTLVVVVNADITLNIPDFRSSERTFSLLNQVAGRAGRRDIKGNVLIQTLNNDHYIMEYIKNHDYKSFYENELKIRHKLDYPPFYYLVSLKILSDTYETASSESINVKNFLKANMPKNVEILGPSISILKIKNIYRFSIMIKYKNEEDVIDTLKKLIETTNSRKDFKIEIDFNPQR